MGAVNYFTSDYITLGLRPYDVDDFTDENNNIDYDETNYCYECDYENIKCELEKHNFHYYHITIKPGYYEGFTLDIKNNFSVALDGYEDRREALKEITEIKQFLTDCAGLGLVKCSPGWCTGYADYNGTIAAIGEAIKAMRDEVKATPTRRQYNKGARKE